MLRLFLVTLISPTAIGGFRAPNEVNLDFEIQRQPGDKYYRANIKDDDMMEMYQKWIDTGLSSLMSAIANQKLKRQRRTVIQQYGQCSAKATDIPKHAKCLTKLLNDEIKPQPSYKSRKVSRLFRYKGSNLWTGSFKTDGRSDFRLRRSLSAKSSTYYKLNSNKQKLTPFGRIAKSLLESVKKMKKKENLPKWQETVKSLRENGKKRRKFKELVENDSEETLSQIQMAAFKSKLMNKTELTADIDVDGMVEDPKKLKEFLKNRKKPITQEERVVNLIRNGMKLAYSLAGQNTTDFESKTMKLISPRFLGLVPDEEEEEKDSINVISPSLFALHNEGKGIENLTSLPNLLQGFSSQDQQLWLDVIMEATGVNDEDAKLKEQVQHYEFNKTMSLMTNITNLKDEHGAPYYATKENITELGGSTETIELFEKLNQNFSKTQLREMNSTGYSILTKPQIELLYGPSSPHPKLEVYRRLMNMSEPQIRRQMRKEFEVMAKMKEIKIDKPQFETDNGHVRRKRQLLPGIVLSPIANTIALLNPLLASQPFILSPVLLTPIILSPSVFGAVILSPWLFVPVILAPRVLGSLILSPFALSPLILTPFAMHPAILSPGVLSPIILSPLLMVPFVLSPQCFTPVILSPLCLSPVILNPMVGSPLILSPFVLSPIVGSPMVLSALVLSPYALSPVVFSPLIAFVVFLSPSWLS
ncbi:unnamed protein product [Bursaphelenchus xylophilus]|uniref:(pine wood nematode) hypothetical protein n=1 Tax=Bursaphelenchus xylophilus TaxID=6326 RepID=A0A1I7SEN5_BURXY|nr:unnamed protein product [Bursaphelenchus xylophilus]CAG9092893.1 unnamed protein product [Bursaphelenchus xylophilus]